MMEQRLYRAPVQHVTAEKAETEDDVLAVEEPLEVRVVFYELGEQDYKTVSITMRTPGHDGELAAGFLFTEGILQSPDQIEKIELKGKPQGEIQSSNIAWVVLKPDVEVDWERLERHIYTSSSCGVCGKTSIDAVFLQSSYLEELQHQTGPVLPEERLYTFPEQLNEQQKIFGATGGLHATALFNAEGELTDVYEDVGRHNAMDKLIGAYFLKRGLPLKDNWVLVSGRASFELMQKAAMAGIPALAAVGAPSSLAKQLAESSGMSLVGFLREKRFNVYTGNQRVKLREKTNHAIKNG